MEASRTSVRTLAPQFSKYRFFGHDPYSKASLAKDILDYRKTSSFYQLFASTGRNQPILSYRFGQLKCSLA
jgi:hypothetical protein